MYKVSLRKPYSTAIVGNSPDTPCQLTGLIPEELISHALINFKNQQEAIDALLSLGITKFQLIDCSWYKEGK